MLEENPKSFSSYRWVIVSLLFFATTVNYFDRIVLSVVIPEIKKELSISDIEYSYVLSFFQFGYTFGSLIAGKFIDWAGTRFGYFFSIVSWSFAATMHATVGSATSLAFWRSLLGISEAGNFPAAIKAISEWFPRKERALATSLFNSGPNIAMITGAPIIAFFTLLLGWRWAFLAIGLSGFILASFWPFFYRKPPESNVDTTFQGKTETKPIPWRELILLRKSWGIMLARFLTDAVWWFYIFWLPNYLNTQRGMNIKEIAIAVPLIYILAILLSNFGGWISGFFIKRGMSEIGARKLTMFISVMCMPVSAFAVAVPDIWIVVLLVGLACGAHGSWAANLFALIADQFPTRAVGSIMGLSTFAGGVGGLLLSTVAVGYIVSYLGYIPIFILMGILHPMGFLFIYFLVSRENATGE
jgi:MFS transporter, ACS family, hexuronate transporter